MFVWVRFRKTDLICYCTGVLIMCLHFFFRYVDVLQTFNVSSIFTHICDCSRVFSSTNLLPLTNFSNVPVYTLVYRTRPIGPQNCLSRTGNRHCWWQEKASEVSQKLIITWKPLASLQQLCFVEKVEMYIFMVNWLKVRIRSVEVGLAAKSIELCAYKAGA